MGPASIPPRLSAGSTWAPGPALISPPGPALISSPPSSGSYGTDSTPSPSEVLRTPCDHNPSLAQRFCSGPASTSFQASVSQGPIADPVSLCVCVGGVLLAVCRLPSLTPSLRLRPHHNTPHAPAMQMQVNWPMRSRHVAWLRQGPDRHSLTSVSQRGPVYPRPHWHRNEPCVFTHRPRCSHGLAPTRAGTASVSGGG